MADHASGKRYLSVAAAIRTAIAAGDYTPGQRLPSERDLAFRFGVSRPTVREAMIHLKPWRSWPCIMDLAPMSTARTRNRPRRRSPCSTSTRPGLCWQPRPGLCWPG
jgi:hypothetical protein